MVVLLVRFNKTKLDLDMLARRTLNSNYKRDHFAACIVRCREGVGLFFASGTVVISFRKWSLRTKLRQFFVKAAQRIDPALKVSCCSVQTMTAKQ